MNSEDALFDAIAEGMLSLFGPWSEHTEELDWSADGGLSLLKVRSLSGSITVRGADQEEITVRATKTVRAPRETAARAFAKRILVSRRRISDGFHVQGLYPNPPLGCTVFVRFDITVPWTLDVDLVTINGGIFISGIEGAVEAETRSGNIDLVDTMGPATLSTAAGTLRATGVEGAINARNGHGPIHFDACAGDLVARATRGELSMTACAGSLRARTYEGDIQALDTRGGAELETGNGDIRATFDMLQAPTILRSDRGSAYIAAKASTAYLEVEALDGKVVVELPKGYAGMLDVGSVGGVIQCMAPVEVIRESPMLLVGKLGAGVGPLVKLRTFDGEITVGEIAADAEQDEGRR